ncbi:MAG TPA: L-threonylcarbamoyladenylate synthase [Gaiellaceae bacterium]|nr:L-threonylcarbamoyladenylate synthase [Gaiellaceae bacterium]
MTSVVDAIAALRTRRPVILPTDTVYGLCAWPFQRETVERLYRLKGRDASKPSALLAASVDALVAAFPELDRALVEEYLPGPYTLVVPNPQHRFLWLTGTNPGAIGVRVPDLPAETHEVVSALGVVCATSANAAGGPNPRRVEDIPEEIRKACGAVVDVGELPGVPSTVLDLTGGEPRVLREGAASS